MDTLTFYDKEKFDFIEDGNTIKVKNKKIGKYIAKFSKDRIKEIYQTTKNNQTHFIVLGRNDSLAHFKVNGINLELVTLAIETSDFAQITDTCYKFYNGERTVLYSLDKESSYDDVYVDTFENDIVLVEDFITEAFGGLNDRLIYGVDINTHEIKTPIWSRLQQRMIKLYTKEEVEKWYNETGIKWNCSVDEFAIYKDVISEMCKIHDRLPLPRRNDIPSDYSLVDDELYDSNGYLNKEFVKRFK